QAEDGIRDATVTGVQTCALPISSRRASRVARSRQAARHGPDAGDAPRLALRLAQPRPLRRGGRELRGADAERPGGPAPRPGPGRSEERRVGEGARCWWWAARWMR